MLGDVNVPDPQSDPFPGHSYLNQQILWDGKREFSLELPTKLLEHLGNPQDKVKTIHVAGTNGKGSVSAMIASILHAAGHKVGQFISPHLSEARERCVISGQAVSLETFDKQLLAVATAATELDLNPSYFEVTSAATFMEFVDSGVDYAVVEVGLGGRLDATNTIKSPEASVITNIAFDHMHILGDTLGKIAFEKAGILKTDVPAFCGVLEDEAREVIEKRAGEVSAPISFLSPGEEVEVCLAGEYQKHNAALAAKVAQHLGVSEEAISAGLRNVRWPGRLELVRDEERNVDVLFDCGHNPQGVEVLLQHLRDKLAFGELKPPRISFMVALLDTKPWQEMLPLYKDFMKEIFLEYKIPTRIVFTDAKQKTSVPPSTLKNHIGIGLAEPSISEAYRESCSGGESLVVVSGSIYLVGRVRPGVVNGEFSTLLSLRISVGSQRQDVKID